MTKSLSLAVVILFLGYATFHYREKSTQQAISNQVRVDSLQGVIDSLANEVFIQSTNVTRYEIAVERLREQDSKAANKFEECLSNIE